jgi:hypothetical protein
MSGLHLNKLRLSGCFLGEGPFMAEGSDALLLQAVIARYDWSKFSKLRSATTSLFALVERITILAKGHICCWCFNVWSEYAKLLLIECWYVVGLAVLQTSGSCPQSSLVLLHGYGSLYKTSCPPRRLCSTTMICGNPYHQPLLWTRHARRHV